MSRHEIQHIPIGELKQYENNARTHSEDQIRKISDSISEFGFTNPILIDADKGIIAGHGRVMAARELGIDTAPCIELSHLTQEQKKAYIIADNKLALDAGWDDELLAFELTDLVDGGFDISLTGFSDEEIDALIPKQIEPGLTDEDAVPDVPEDPVTRIGDIWICGDHRVMCGDSTSIDDVDKLMNGNKADMVFADPPYGIDVVQSSQVGGGGPTKFGKVGGINIVESKTYSKIIGDETTDTARDFYNTCVSLGMNNIVLWGGNYFTDFLTPSRCWVVWDKEMTGNFSEAEMAWTSFSKGGIKVFKFLWNGLSREGNRKDELASRVHPTQKPVGLFQMIFERFDGFQSIYDGFGGSGSTLIASEKTNRNCLMMELDPKYCDVIVNRWQEYTGKDAILESSGESFNSLSS